MHECFPLLQDEIDDSRKTLQYAVSELQNDVEKELLALPESERAGKNTEFGIFVVHNKRKEKLGKLPEGLPYVCLLYGSRVTHGMPSYQLLCWTGNR